MIYKDSLTILKICNNKITTLDQVKKLSEISNLIKLDLSGNEVCKIDDYRKKVFDSISTLQCLDGKDQDNQSIESDDDEDEYGEEGEQDLDGVEFEIPEHVIEQLDPEIREKYKSGELSKDELLEFINNAEELDGLGEEGEFDLDDEEGEAAQADGDAGGDGEDDKDSE